MILEITIEILADPKATYILSSIRYGNRITTTTMYPHTTITMKTTKKTLLSFLCKDCLTIIHLQVIPKFKRKGKNKILGTCCNERLIYYYKTCTDHGQLLFVSSIYIIIIIILMMMCLTKPYIKDWLGNKNTTFFG